MEIVPGRGGECHTATPPIEAGWQGTTSSARTPASLRDREYRGQVLDRLAEYTCEVLGVDQACVFVREPGDHSASLAASCGAGEHAAEVPNGDLIDLVLALGEPVVVTRGNETAQLSTWGSTGVTDAHTAAPITSDG